MSSQGLRLAFDVAANEREKEGGRKNSERAFLTWTDKLTDILAQFNDMLTHTHTRTHARAQEHAALAQTLMLWARFRLSVH